MDRRTRRVEYGQNYLRNNQLVEQLVSKAGINKEDTVLEIGAGSAVITEQLAKVSNNVIALEIDTVLYEELKKKYESIKSIQFMNKDFNTLNLAKLGLYKFFSNIPFNQSAAVIRKLLIGKNRPESAHIIMQEEAADKFLGDPVALTSQASCLIKPFYSSRIVHYFKASDFKPAPNVNCVLVRFDKLATPKIKDNEITIYKDFIFYLFNNNKDTFIKSISKLIKHEDAIEISKQYEIDFNKTITEIRFKEIFTVFLQYMRTHNKNDFLLLNQEVSIILRKQPNLLTWYNAFNN